MEFAPYYKGNDRTSVEERIRKEELARQIPYLENLDKLEKEKACKYMIETEQKIVDSFSKINDFELKKCKECWIRDWCCFVEYELSYNIYTQLIHQQNPHWACSSCLNKLINRRKEDIGDFKFLRTTLKQILSKFPQTDIDEPDVFKLEVCISCGFNKMCYLHQSSDIHSSWGAWKEKHWFCETCASHFVKKVSNPRYRQRIERKMERLRLQSMNTTGPKDTDCTMYHGLRFKKGPPNTDLTKMERCWRCKIDKQCHCHESYRDDDQTIFVCPECEEASRVESLYSFVSRNF